ncbi:MAG: preprotein translocase subunit SecE [Pseudomonadota bacterium]
MDKFTRNAFMLTVVAVGVIVWYMTKVAVEHTLGYFDIYLRSSLAEVIKNLLPVIFGGIAAYIPYRVERIKLYLLEVITEVKKVTWPPKKETWGATVVVIIAVIISAVVLWVFDLLSNFGMGFILKR